MDILAFRYIWIDSICLDSEDPNQLKILTGEMSSVYEGAYVGNDANAGLPGVQAGSRIVAQHVENNDDMKFVVTMPSLKWKLSEAQWSKRGWTLQEGMMSRRYLIFTDDQVY